MSAPQNSDGSSDSSSVRDSGSRKAGRPPGDPESRRDSRVIVTLSQREHAAIQALATTTGETLSTLCRRLIFAGLAETPVTPKVPREGA